MGYGERSWPLIAGATIAAIVLLAGVFMVGRASAPEGATATGSGESPPQAATRAVGGVTVGVLRSQAGALAAADNYAVAAAGSQISDPDRFREFVQTVYIPSAQRDALSTSDRASRAATETAAFYRDGGRKVTLTAARRLKSYDGKNAVVESWGADVLWGPGQKSQQNWKLLSTSLVWDKGAWRVASISQLRAPGPAPAVTLRAGGEDRRSYFDEQLRGMTQPVYGAN